MQVTETNFSFKAKDYELVFDFFGCVDSDESSWKVGARDVAFVLMRKEEGDYWDKLQKGAGCVSGGRGEWESFFQSCLSLSCVPLLGCRRIFVCVPSCAGVRGCKVILCNLSLLSLCIPHPLTRTYVVQSVLFRVSIRCDLLTYLATFDNVALAHSLCFHDALLRARAIYWAAQGRR